MGDDQPSSHRRRNMRVHCISSRASFPPDLRSELLVCRQSKDLPSVLGAADAVANEWL